MSFNELITDKQSTSQNDSCRTRYGTFAECPLCTGDLTPEHAHFKCRTCGWRDSCCD
ncbi:MAG: hypothetical protein F2650_05600 [Actinobacteria bacterium]|nr:hypothetical protein [Actinomycetota bacterium]MTB12163.1 hypothetical protein [Actinomycetota bacterium]